MPYDKATYEANREKVLEYQRAYRLRNPEKNKLRLKKYKAANKEKFAGYERKRRATKRLARTEAYSTSDVISTYGDSCYLCGSKIDLMAERRSGKPGWEFGLQIDHLQPLYLQGADTIENVRPTHGLCNMRKNRYNPKG